MRCRRRWQTEAALGSEPERRPGGGSCSCSADSTQGKASPAPGAVSEGPRGFPPPLNFPFTPRGQTLQPVGNFLQPCRSATLPRLPTREAVAGARCCSAGPAPLLRLDR